jgi:hypothetical protein
MAKTHSKRFPLVRWLLATLIGTLTFLLTLWVFRDETKASGFMAFILTFSFGAFLVVLGCTFWDLHRSINNAIAFLAKTFPAKQRVNSPEQLRNVDEYFASDPFLAEAWQEFYEGITINDDDPDLPAVYNADNSPAFFDEYAVIESNMYTQFWVNLPGMFTAFGILGTFYGLINTLKTIKHEGSNEEAVTMVMDALPGMHLAFYCSLLGVGFYILFSMFERYWMSKLSHSVSTLQSRIDSVFVRIPEHRFLKRTVALLEQQDSKFKTLNHTLAVEVGSEIRKNLDGHLNDIVGAMRTVVTQLTAAREESVKQQLELHTTMQEAISSSLRPVFDNIQQVLDRQTNSASDKISSALSNVLENIGENLERASAEASSGFRNAAENLGNTLMECNRQMQQVSSNIAEIGGTVRTSAEGFHSSAQLFIQASERGQSLVSGLGSAAAVIQPMVETNERTLSGYSALLDKTGAVADTLQSSVGQFAETTNAAIQQTHRSSSHLEQLTERYLQQSTEVSQTLAMTASSAVSSFERTRTELAGIFNLLYEQMQGYKQSIEGYNHTVREGLSSIFKAFDQETENLVTAYAGICSTTRSTSQEVAVYTEDMCRNNIAAMKESSEAIVNLSRSLADISKQGSALDQLEQKVKEILTQATRVQVPALVHEES